MDYDALVPNPDPDPNPTPNLLKVDYDALVANGTYCELSKIGASLYNEASVNPNLNPNPNLTFDPRAAT